VTFKWGTNTWALDGTEEPARPWSTSYDERSVEMFTPSGYRRSTSQYRKTVFAWYWPSATKTASDNIKSIMAYGAFTVESAYGTYTMALMPDSYSCVVSGYGAFTINVTAAEV
jgi:hypothetical protein